MSASPRARATSLRSTVARFGLAVVTLVCLTGCSSLVNGAAFHPTKGRREVFRAEWGRELWLEAEDGVSIEAFLFENPNAEQTLLYFHGNAGHAGHRFASARTLSRLGINVLLVSYRGYGNSDGSPSEKGLYRDGRAALRYLREDLAVPLEDIVVFGRSIGSAVAVEVARGQPVAGVVLVTPVSSGRDLARELGFGWLGWLAGNPFDNVKKLPEVLAPTLVIVAERDQITPAWMGSKLHEAAPQPAAFHRLRGADHNNLEQVARRQYFTAMAEFLQLIGARATP